MANEIPQTFTAKFNQQDDYNPHHLDDADLEIEPGDEPTGLWMPILALMIYLVYLAIVQFGPSVQTWMN